MAGASATPARADSGALRWSRLERWSDSWPRWSAGVWCILAGQAGRVSAGVLLWSSSRLLPVLIPFAYWFTGGSDAVCDHSIAGTTEPGQCGCWRWPGLVLSILTPFYHPYARLWLPLQLLGWVLMAGA